MFFNTRRRNFISLRGHVISSIYSSSKLQTKLEVISGYHKVVRFHFVKQPKQAEKSRICTPNLVPKLQWNPVNMTTFWPWKFGRINGVVVLTGQSQIMVQNAFKLHSTTCIPLIRYKSTFLQLINNLTTASHYVTEQ